MDHGQMKKPRIFQGKPVRWPDRGFGHLTGELNDDHMKFRFGTALAVWPVS